MRPRQQPVNIEPGHEIRVDGPPGTGKTTYLSRRIRDTVRARGPQSVAVCSFTRAAAAELAGRHLPVPPKMVGTLHSFAYRSLDESPVVVSDEHISEWNLRHPEYRLRTAAMSSPDTQPRSASAAPGEALRSQAELLRNQLVPAESWPYRVYDYYEAWRSWLAAEDLWDYTLLVEESLRSSTRMPGNPSVVFVDEAQDLTPLELALVRHWGQSAERIVMVGDADQSVYSFRGATPDGIEAFPIPEEDRRYLAQSYRVPARVHDAAARWIDRCSHRLAKAYHPRDFEGAVTGGQGATYRSPRAVWRAVESHLSAGRTVMVLAPCAYLLEPFRAVLRREGVPYHNPYRPHDARSNPLALHRERDDRAGRAQVTSARRVASHLVPGLTAAGALRGGRRLWTRDELWHWLQLLEPTADVVAQVKDLATGRGLSIDELLSVFDAEELLEVLDHASAGSVGWLREQLPASRLRQVDYVLRVVERRGAQQLLEEPKLVVGTVHSVKGGESDCVFLIPDMSPSFHKQWMHHGESRDSIVRMYYVAMTRAREELIVCSPASGSYVSPGMLTEG